MRISMTLAMVSLSIGVVGCYVPILISSGSWEWQGAISLSLAIFWAGALVSSLVRFGKRGLRFSVGAPFVLLWPTYYFLMVWIFVR
jgi:hypothetical protein